MICIFCLRVDGDATPWCPDRPGGGCTYGLSHEFPVTEAQKPQSPPKGPDKKLCTKCGLHPKNPASATNGCGHEYAI